MGTSDYIAPEQARGHSVDAQSDIYSLGAVLYELLTGDVPFRGDNFVAVAMRHINEPPPSVRERRPDVSPRLDAAIRRAMAKNPRDRFGSMDELCRELNACLEGETAASGAQTMVVAPRRQRRPAGPPQARPMAGPIILLLAGIAVLAGILAAVFAFTGSGERLTKLVHRSPVGGGGAAPTLVTLTGVSAYDPYGDNEEHDSSAGNATDGNLGTYWNTEHYNGGLNKDGVGLVLDAGADRKLTQLVVRSGTPGFVAAVKAGSSTAGPFTKVSDSQTVGSSTTFELDGTAARYYVVWITDLGPSSSVEINEVTAKGR
jgi:serine/threonine-protein kinase